MMSIFEKRGDRQVDTGMNDGEKLSRLRRGGRALQRQMRRRVAEHDLQRIHTWQTYVQAGGAAGVHGDYRGGGSRKLFSAGKLFMYKKI